VGDYEGAILLDDDGCLVFGKGCCERGGWWGDAGWHIDYFDMLVALRLSVVRQKLWLYLRGLSVVSRRGYIAMYLLILSLLSLQLFQMTLDFTVLVCALP
jgi:hypothetical protein